MRENQILTARSLRTLALGVDILVHVDQLEDVLPGQLVVAVEGAAVSGDHGGLAVLGEGVGPVLHDAVHVVLDVVVDHALLGELVLLVLLDVLPLDDDEVVAVSARLLVINTCGIIIIDFLNN